MAAGRADRPEPLDRVHSGAIVPRWPALIPRLEANIRVDENGCWIWTGTIAKNGYGTVYALGRFWKAHRLIYELLVGPVPAGLDLDHVRERGCRSRACCNT